MVLASDAVSTREAITFKGHPRNGRPLLNEEPPLMLMPTHSPVPLLSSGGSPDESRPAVRHRSSMGTAMKRATATAAALFALAAAGAAEAQDVFLKCGDHFFRFNVSNNSIHMFSQDGEDLGSMCVLPRDRTDNSGSDRYRYENYDLRCSVNDAEIRVSYTQAFYLSSYLAGRCVDERLINRGHQLLFLINRRSGTFGWERGGDNYVSGSCLQIERPQPRANLF